MSRRYWTQEEDAYIRDNYRRGNARLIAKHLNRSLPAVRTRATTLGIQVTLREWTADDTRFLIEHYDTMTNTAIAAHLDVHLSVLHNHVAALRQTGEIVAKTGNDSVPATRTDNRVGLSDFGENSLYNTHLNIVCTPEQKYLVEQLAIERGLSMSAFMREIIDKLED